MDDLKAIIESLLFVADKPLGVEKLAEIIEEADSKAIRAGLEALLDEFNNPGRGFRLHEVAGGYQFRTHPECQAYIRRMLKPAPSRLSRAALETLAIIAYKQPIIRSDIEHIRGVDSGGVLRVLMEKKLIRVLGRREIPGRPLIYATTKYFLEVFDLKNLKDLPTPKEIEELTAQEPDLEEPSDGDSLPKSNASEAAAAVAEDGEEAEELTLAGPQGDRGASYTAEEVVPMAETPNPSGAQNHSAKSDTVATAGTLDEASDEATNEATAIVTERSDGQTTGSLDVFADDASDDASDEASDDASTDDALDEATDMAPDHDGLDQQDDDGEAIGDKGETAL
jgi:segregation and condensation protein B